ncbi:MAG: type II toxin-antitoxin system VapC family toxin [Propionibacteriaceae bacterium]|nr:type II toxin-antitoxin system VapC family toxin [Propionibacteriaceae bacterium]
MSLAYLLDTNVLIDILRGEAIPLRERFRAAAGRVAVSAISVMELEFGADRSSDPAANRRKAATLLALTEQLPFGLAAAENAGRLRATLMTIGQTIGAYDTLIAGHARSAGLTLVTNNVREFGRVPGLAVENWLADR